MSDISSNHKAQINDKIKILNLASDIVANKYSKYLIPIYGAKDNGRPYHIGTSILLSFIDRNFLVTADHIIKETKYTRIYAGINGKLNDITSMIYISSNDDSYDFAFSEINGTRYADIFTDFINEGDIILDIPNDEKILFIGLGYPNSQNHGYLPDEYHVRSNLASYSLMRNNNDRIISKLPAGVKHHIPLNYRKFSLDENGKKTKTIKPKGMSGGAVFDLGDISDLSFDKNSPKLTGMIIELKEFKGDNAIVAVRIGQILYTIKRYYEQI